MDKQIEALKMAIEALAKHATDESDEGWQYIGAIQACKEALAEAEKQEPVTRDWKKTIDERIAKDDDFKKALAEAINQEIGDYEIKAMLDDIEWYQQEQRKLINRIKELEKKDDIEKQLDYAHARGFKEGAENAYKKMEQPVCSKCGKPTQQGECFYGCRQEQPKQEPVAWMEEYQSCKVNEDERLCHSDKVFRLVQLLASQSKELQSLSDDEIAIVIKTTFPVNVAVTSLEKLSSL